MFKVSADKFSYFIWNKQQKEDIFLKKSAKGIFFLKISLSLQTYSMRYDRLPDYYNLSKA